MDVEHEDLRQAIWINPKEKLNQKDDDRNGLIDDINGWNFLGGKDAQVVESLTREGEREFFRLKDKYADYIFDGKKYYKKIKKCERCVIYESIVNELFMKEEVIHG